MTVIQAIQIQSSEVATTPSAAIETVAPSVESLMLPTSESIQALDPYSPVGILLASSVLVTAIGRALHPKQ
jgi:hypothetical protein